MNQKLNDNWECIFTVDPEIYEGESGPEYIANNGNKQSSQQNPQEYDWYVPQGAIPQGFELEENLGKENIVLQQPINVPQPPDWMNGGDENQPMLYDWADYSKKYLEILVSFWHLSYDSEA